MSGFRYRPFRTQPRRLSRMTIGRGFVTNSPPTITVPGAQSAVSNVALAITGTSIADTDGNSQTVSLSVSHGTFSLASTTGLSFSAGDGTSDAAMTFSGTPTNINAALATITYTSTTDYVGSDSLSVSTNDGLGGLDSDSIAITVTFTPLSLTLDSFVDIGTQTYSDAGTTLCGSGDAIRQANDLSGNGRKWNQATLGNRAIYNIGANGKAFATFNGSKFYDSLTIPGSGGILAFGQVKFTALGYHNIIDRASSNPMIWIDGSGRFECNVAAVVSTAKNDGVWRYFALFTGQGTTRTVLWLDGTVVNDVAVAGTVTSAVISLFNRGGSSGFNGSCSCLGFLSGGYTAAAAAVSNMASWFASRAPT